MKPYLIRLQIQAFDPCHINIDAINTHILAEWHFRCQSIELEPPCIEWTGEGLLALPEMAFADRLAQVIWIAGNGPCKIVIHFYNLSLAPVNTVTRSATNHERLMVASTPTELGEIQGQHG